MGRAHRHGCASGSPELRAARAFAKDQPVSVIASSIDPWAPRDFHARLTRDTRGRPVLARRRHRLRKRYAALVAAVLIPAIASATEWPTAQDNLDAGASARIERASLNRAAYVPLGDPSQIHWDSENTAAIDALGGPAARPFAAAGSELDRARAEQCLTMAIYYEAATEPDDGQKAVAQVVLNRVAHPSYPNTVCGVVFQGSERSTGCQFSFTCDGSLARRPMAYWWDRARRVADAALAGFVYAPVGLATHYHTFQVHPAWSDALVPVIAIGAHQFFRFPGAAGAKAAFRVAYFGGEPTAGPHPHAFNPAPSSDPDPLAIVHAFDVAQPAAVSAPARAGGVTSPAKAAPLPAYAPEVEARGGDALFRASNLPDGSGLSPELQRSGQWLRNP